MTYEPVPLPFKPHRLSGLSERLIVSHYENNYGGAVRRLNAIDRRLAALDRATAPVFELNGLGRERLMAANSTILHEVYFDGLGGAGEPAGAMAEALERDFGSVAQWRTEFAGMGKALGGGSGWVLLTWSARLGRLTNQWAADHCHGLADGIPVLALDMYEHAYALDFGANAGAYVDSIMPNLHWERIAARYRRATAAAPVPASASADPTMTAAELLGMIEAGGPVAVVDVCLADDLSRRFDTIPGARFVPAETMAAWADDLPRDRPIAVSCIYGFQVSGEAAAELRRRGFDARQLIGGLTAWHALGAPTIPLPGTSNQGEAA
jgi:Fe-Mn family superoxide dismutase